ncbi:MAG TPA: FliM/FliN family flagellar motor C-terminal domain-containing protein [Hydrogenophaga sp.]|uniref:FliM/FliN family flagellar motor C-terminal domain-containing protein n=1 Tax=Hydrogenophaga sp. TaxID=1904254 RepID=UPI002BBAD98E|nr:FliM/FliN family flagellar motor C-terminal domain-containing protein [Hydrogenophaga sp.]HSX91414.1 FliM/FliN family flagellar motor C-terminal domain-containing protein [Hydrogenophaga sp.]
MSHTPHILPPAAGARLTALDPCELGRPIHALDSLFQLTQQDLDQALAAAFPGRVGAPVRLGGVSHGRTNPIETTLRWATYRSGAGRSAFAIERSALTALLARRYGSTDWELGARCVPPLETATEQRLAAQLGQVLSQALMRRIGAGEHTADDESSLQLEQNLPTARCPISGPTMFLWAQVLAGSAPLGLVVFALDSDTLATALRQLAPARRQSAARAADGASLRRALPLRLDVRLAQKTLPLGELLGLKPGDVLAISLDTATVRVQDNPVLKAMVVENKGRLCLTNLQEV